MKPGFLVMTNFTLKWIIFLFGAFLHVIEINWFEVSYNRNLFLYICCIIWQLLQWPIFIVLPWSNIVWRHFLFIFIYRVSQCKWNQRTMCAHSATLKRKISGLSLLLSAVWLVYWWHKLYTQIVTLTFALSVNMWSGPYLPSETFFPFCTSVCPFTRYMIK